MLCHDFRICEIISCCFVLAFTAKQNGTNKALETAKNKADAKSLRCLKLNFLQSNFQLQLQPKYEAPKWFNRKAIFETESTFISWSRWWFHPLFLGKMESNLTLRIFLGGKMGWWFNHQLGASNWCFGLGILGSLKTKRIGVYYSSYRPLKVPRRPPSIWIPNPKRPNSKKSKKNPLDSNSLRFFNLGYVFVRGKKFGSKPPGKIWVQKKSSAGPKPLRNLPTAPRQELVSRCGRGFWTKFFCWE